MVQVKVVLPSSSCTTFFTADSASPTRLCFYASEDTDYYYYERTGRADGLDVFVKVTKSGTAKVAEALFVDAATSETVLLLTWTGSDSTSQELQKQELHEDCGTGCPTITWSYFGSLLVIDTSISTVSATFAGFSGVSACNNFNRSMTADYVSGIEVDGYRVVSYFERTTGSRTLFFRSGINTTSAPWVRTIVSGDSQSVCGSTDYHRGISCRQATSAVIGAESWGTIPVATTRTILDTTNILDVLQNTTGVSGCPNPAGTTPCTDGTNPPGSVFGDITALSFA
jgi:hypothetical protein